VQEFIWLMCAPKQTFNFENVILHGVRFCNCVLGRAWQRRIKINLTEKRLASYVRPVQQVTLQ